MMRDVILCHHGILGQKWGVRNGPPYPLGVGGHSASEKKAMRKNPHVKTNKNSKEVGGSKSFVIKNERLSVTTKTGDKISLLEEPPSRFARFLSRHFKGMADVVNNTASFKIQGPDGKKVGELSLYKEAPDSINAQWLGIRDSVRGRGYATAVMQSVVEIAKDTGCRTITLEVPGNSPDARHIYEKVGFKEVASPDRDEDDVWGGLTNMRLDLPYKSKTLSHSRNLIPISKSFARRYTTILAKYIERFSFEKLNQELINSQIVIKLSRLGRNFI